MIAISFMIKDQANKGWHDNNTYVSFITSIIFRVVPCGLEAPLDILGESRTLVCLHLHPC